MSKRNNQQFEKHSLLEGLNTMKNFRCYAPLQNHHNERNRALNLSLSNSLNGSEKNPPAVVAQAPSKFKDARN